MRTGVIITLVIGIVIILWSNGIWSVYMVCETFRKMV